MTDIDGLIGGYHDNCFDETLEHWLTDPVAMNEERLRLMDHRSEYVSSEELKEIVSKALKLRQHRRNI
jgi:hypothetical protein